MESSGLISESRRLEAQAESGFATSKLTIVITQTEVPSIFSCSSNLPGKLSISFFLLIAPAAPKPKLSTEPTFNQLVSVFQHRTRATGNTEQVCPLPNEFQGKLDISWLGCQRVYFAAGYDRASLIKDPGSVDRLRRRKVGVIQNIENLRAELNIERLRPAMDRNVLD
jgi:hypothetical protein